MRRLKKILLGGTLFFTYANQVWATTTAEATSKGAKTVIVLVIGIALVTLVLFIGYKLDSESPEKQKNKKQDNNEEDSIKGDVYKTANEEDVPYEIENDEKYESDKINLADINENTEYTDSGDEESLFLSLSKVKGYDSFEELEEINEEIEEEHVNNNISNKQLFDSTMEFNMDIFDNKEIEEIQKIEEKKEDIKDNNTSQKDDVEETIINPNDIFANLPNIMNVENDIEEKEESLYEVQETEFAGFTVKEDNSGALLNLEQQYSQENNIAEDVKKEMKVSEQSENVDYDFLAQMEENLINNQNKRIEKKEETKKETEKKTKKSTSAKSKTDVKENSKNKKNTSKEKHTKTDKK